MRIINIGIVGLGLIGGSLAKAFKKYTDCTVSGYDINPETIGRAVKEKTIDCELKIDECDMLVMAVYPADTVRFLQENGAQVKKGAIVCDCGGTKEYVCGEAEKIAAEHGFTFVGAHPMAGTEHSGFDFSDSELFKNASLIICSDKKQPEMEGIFGKIGFGCFKYTTAKEHDAVIAYTSQLAHVVSNAFVKSPAYRRHKGFSAGSLKDLTRVAWLNETMWTELFMENRENLVREIDNLIDNLKKYSDAVRSGDEAKLKSLLREGRTIKESVDGR